MVISTHIKPESGSTDMTTENEINYLEDVYNDAIARRPDYADATCIKLIQVMIYKFLSK